MKKIKLTQKKFALVDDDDYEYLTQWKWYAVQGNTTYYAVRNPSGKDSHKTNLIKMHRIIMKPKTEQHIDHADGNGLNNRRSNLRKCTRSQNSANGGPKGGTSKYRGVSWKDNLNKWQAQVQVTFPGQKRKNFHLGYYRTEEAAARAYDEAALSFFKEFAYQNFPAGEKRR